MRRPRTYVLWAAVAAFFVDRLWRKCPWTPFDNTSKAHHDRMLGEPL